MTVLGGDQKRLQRMKASGDNSLLCEGAAETKTETVSLTFPLVAGRERSDSSPKAPGGNDATLGPNPLEGSDPNPLGGFGVSNP